MATLYLEPLYCARCPVLKPTSGAKKQSRRNVFPKLGMRRGIHSAGFLSYNLYCGMTEYTDRPFSSHAEPVSRHISQSFLIQPDTRPRMHQVASLKT